MVVLGDSTNIPVYNTYNPIESVLKGNFDLEIMSRHRFVTFSRLHLDTKPALNLTNE